MRGLTNFWKLFYYKMLFNSITCYGEIICERKSQSCGQLHCCLISRNFHSHPSLQHIWPWSVNSHQHGDKTLHQQNCWNLSWRLAFLRNKIFLIEMYFFFDNAIAHLIDDRILTFICTGKQKFIWLALLWYKLYCGGLEPHL